MFGTVILVAGVTLVSAIVEKALEEMGKESQAQYLGLATRGGLAIYAVKEINDVFREATRDFL
jgi:hypothetical protein